MARFFPPNNVQAASHQLRNEICRLSNPESMAEVSSHLRNFAVAEVIGFIAMLDGHPRIIGQPVVREGPARFQQARGKTENPLAHAIPSDMLLNGDSLVKLYRSAEARTALERVFGMGVMAPEDWEKQNTFAHEPRQLNVVDTISESHQYGAGLVEAFKACGEAAVRKGVWDGSGKRRHDLNSLTKFIAEIYGSTWVPGARSAYMRARSHFAAQLALARNSNPQRLRMLQQRCDILNAQFRVFERETTISPEAAKNVWKFVAAETWT
jgi:hypothetical protein